jgi:hypothetical protein
MWSTSKKNPQKTRTPTLTEYNEEELAKFTQSNMKEQEKHMEWYKKEVCT